MIKLDSVWSYLGRSYIAPHFTQRRWSVLGKLTHWFKSSIKWSKDYFPSTAPL